jgi:dihydroorotate dehydrogenase
MSKFDLVFLTSLMNAAGSLGFMPPVDHPDYPRLGAFVTNPISFRPRRPVRNPLVLYFSGGFLLHTGHPNPGLKNALRWYADRWKRLDIPVIAHILCERVDELPLILSRLETDQGIMAIELGLPPQATPALTLAVIRATTSELPIILRIPIDRIDSLVELLAEPETKGKIAAYSLGPPRGLLPYANRFVHGRLYGPALYPQGLAALRTLLSLEIPVIGGGGVFTLEQAEVMVAAGAVAVQIDAALWRGSLPAE